MAAAFARAKIMMAAIAAAMALATRGEQQTAMGKVGQYKSRGKGRGTAARNYLRGLGRSKYEPHQGEREKSRRRARMVAKVPLKMAA